MAVERARIGLRSARACSYRPEVSGDGPMRNKAAWMIDMATKTAKASKPAAAKAAKPAAKPAAKKAAAADPAAKPAAKKAAKKK